MKRHLILLFLSLTLRAAALRADAPAVLDMPPQHRSFEEIERMINLNQLTLLTGKEFNGDPRWNEQHIIGAFTRNTAGQYAAAYAWNPDTNLYDEVGAWRGSLYQPLNFDTIPDPTPEELSLFARLVLEQRRRFETSAPAARPAPVQAAAPPALAPAPAAAPEPTSGVLGWVSEHVLLTLILAFVVLVIIANLATRTRSSSRPIVIQHDEAQRAFAEHGQRLTAESHRLHQLDAAVAQQEARFIQRVIDISERKY
ncbi:MAG: hypothetical protein ABIT01_03000 [Thermoanaerobaculia bacterium]